MEKRLKLDRILRDLLGTGNVYFQPPPEFKMEFPCIVYEFAQFNTRYADNQPYQLMNQYRITYLDDDPDSDMPEKIALLPKCIGERAYESDNLYHYPFRITY